jgi:hypothetical protein
MQAIEHELLKIFSASTILDEPGPLKFSVSIFPSECRASGEFFGRSRNVRLIDETAFPFLDPNQSFGALQAKAKSKRADSRLRSLKPNGA